MKNGYILVLLMLVLSGCQSYVAMRHEDLEKSYVKKSYYEENLKKVKDEYAEKLAKKEQEISTAKDSVIKGQDGQMQAAADDLYFINKASSFFPQLGALEIAKKRSTLGLTALGKSPTLQTLLTVDQEIQKEIDANAKQDAEALKKLKDEYNALLVERGLLVKDTENAKEEVKTLQVEKENLKVEKETAVATAQEKVNQATNDALKKSTEVIAAEKAARESAEKLEKTKREIMIWCGIGAVIAMAGAVYSPVGKGGLAIIAGILAFVAVAIMYIQPWMVLTVGLVGAAGAIGYVLYRHNLAETSNENMINAIQDVKEKASPAYEDLKKSLQEWNTAYKTTKSGEITEVADKKVMDYIDKKLTEYGRYTKKK
jgi:hypothetical protein